MLRNPTKGDNIVELKGLRYVLIEPAGSDWLPLGMVGQETQVMLRAGTGVHPAVHYQLTERRSNC